MNAEHAILFEGGIIDSSRRTNRYRSGRRGPLPFLHQPKPVCAGPRVVVRDAATARESAGRHSGWAEKLETLGLKLVAALFGIVVLCCGFGAQHISYVRAKNQLGRELTQREQDLRKVTQAYRALESRKAVELAAATPGPAQNIAAASVPQTRPAAIAARGGSRAQTQEWGQRVSRPDQPATQLAKVVSSPKAGRSPAARSPEKRPQATNAKSRTAGAGVRG